MKKSIAILAVLASASAVFAGPKKAPAMPKTIHCAVMTKDTLNVAEATKAKRYEDYKGHRYYFCCEGCPQAFHKNPAKYAKNESTAIPKK